MQKKSVFRSIEDENNFQVGENFNLREFIKRSKIGKFMKSNKKLAIHAFH